MVVVGACRATHTHHTHNMEGYIATPAANQTEHLQLWKRCDVLFKCNPAWQVYTQADLKYQYPYTIIPSSPCTEL